MGAEENCGGYFEWGTSGNRSLTGEGNFPVESLAETRQCARYDFSSSVTMKQPKPMARGTSKPELPGKHRLRGSFSGSIRYGLNVATL
jgi:hypothetical protein